MQQDQHFSLWFLRALFLVFLAAVLSACAGRPKPIEPSRPYTVTEVRVIAQRTEHSHFAQRLQTRLEASVGRATADVGQTSELRIVVLERREEQAPVYFFGGTSQTVSLDLAVVDSSTGQVLRSQVLGLNFTDYNGSNAETVLINRLTDDIRRLLGLSGYTAYPVRGNKRDVVRPRAKPDDADVTDEELRSVDPLLNGTVTPTTVVLDVEPDTAPVVDYTKPLLEPQPAAKPVVPAQTMTLRPSKPLQQENDVADENARASGSGDAVDFDEPCVITLENDCSDPDSR